MDWFLDDFEDGDYDFEMKERNSSRSDSGGGGGGDNDGGSSLISVSLVFDGVVFLIGLWEGYGFGNVVELGEVSNEEIVYGLR